MSTGVVIEFGIALSATAMDGDAGWCDLSMGFDMVSATVFWLKIGVFDVFGGLGETKDLAMVKVTWLDLGVFGVFPAEVHLGFLGSSRGVG